MIENKIRSVTDLPLQNKKEDLLKLNRYAKGLYDFIRNTETPMSIAIQGDWGTGKTSILNLINNLNSEYNSKIKTFYINTWQFSQFNGSDMLYFSFITSLINQMEIDKVNTKRVLSNFGKLALAAGKSALSISGLSDLTSLVDLAEKWEKE